MGSPVRQIAVFLSNRVGALLSIVKMLHANHILVLGVSVQDSVDVTVVRLIVSDPESVEDLFMEKGIAYCVSELVVVELENGAESLAYVLQSLLNAETNIHFVYPILTRPRDRPALAMCVEDIDFAVSALGKEGYKVLYQEDLSR